MNIFISGSMAYDRIMDFPGYFKDYILPDKIHVLNVCFNVNGLQEKFGGTAGNIAYSLGLLGERPTIIAAIGKDYPTYFAWLQKNNLSTDGIEVVPEEFTAGAYITTDRSDNQITGFNPGAMKRATSFDLNSADPKSSVVLIAPGNLQDMTGYASRCRELGIPYICDPGQSLTLWDGELMREWIRGSMMLITNDYELEIIMKMTGLTKGEILGLAQMIITTLGEKGSLISRKGKQDRMIPSAKVTGILDPTGAGDAYRAGLLKGLAMNRDMEASAMMGAVAAAYAVEQYGTQEHSYTFEEFLSRYRDNFGELER
ncbi:MAG TPA: carbohydrate kinase family protein [Thermodesulfovibrionales bacterium]|nr:carbohydrate kinase family protein [Thermodesulfovibrionales bacterium]